MKQVAVFISLILIFLSIHYFFVSGPIGADVVYADESLGEGTIDGDTLPNPLSTSDPREIIGNVIKAVLGLTGSLALLMFIFGGFTWVTSAGNEEKIKKGKEMITWAAFGLFVIFASYALVNFVIGAVTGGAAQS